MFRQRGKISLGAQLEQKYVVYAKHPDSGYLKHVYNVLERAGNNVFVSYSISNLTLWVRINCISILTRNI